MVFSTYKPGYLYVHAEDKIQNLCVWAGRQEVFEQGPGSRSGSKDYRKFNKCFALPFITFNQSISLFATFF